MGKAMYVIKSSLDANDAAAVYGCLCLRLPSRPSLLFSFLFFSQSGLVAQLPLISSLLFSISRPSLLLFYVSPLGDLGIGLV